MFYDKSQEICNQRAHNEKLSFCETFYKIRGKYLEFFVAAKVNLQMYL
jgi:hypothetical protein